MKKKLKKEENNPQRENKAKQLFLVINHILSSKPIKDENFKYTNAIFSILSSSLFGLVGWGLFIIVFLVLFYLIYYYIFEYEWQLSIMILSSIFTILGYLLILFVVFLVSIILIGSAKEQQESKDINKTTTIFSALVSFVALIISLIALLK